VGDYRAIRHELERYSPDLANRPEIVVMTKSDLPDVREAYGDAKTQLAENGVDLHLVSAATHDGIDALLSLISTRLSEMRAAPPPDASSRD
jgi:GTP-binding protein